MDNVDSIIKNGLRVGNATSMFGRGIYTAESSTKADQYAGMSSFSPSKL
jgi:hypothetical protein